MLALAPRSAGTKPGPCGAPNNEDCPFDARYCKALPGRAGECAIKEADVEAKCGAWDACGAVVCDKKDDAEGYCFARTSAQVLWGSQGSAGQRGFVKRPPPPPAGKRCAGASAGLLPAQCDAWIALFDALRFPNVTSAYQERLAPLKCASPLNRGREDPCGCRTASGNKPLCGLNGTAIANIDFSNIASASGTLPAAVTALSSLLSFVLTGTKVRRQAPPSLPVLRAAAALPLPLPLPLPPPPPPPPLPRARVVPPAPRSPAAPPMLTHARARFFFFRRPADERAAAPGLRRRVDQPQPAGC
jgi:hypothetical protein